MSGQHQRRPVPSTSGILFLLLGLLILTFVLFLLHSTEQRQAESDTSLPEQSEAVMIGDIECTSKKNITTYLFMGIDNTASQGENYVTGGQCDVLQLVVVDRSHRSYKRLAINRNTMMEVHSYDMDGEDLGTTYCQIALAHSSGDGGVLSAEYAVNAVSEYLLDAKIDHYAAIGMESMSFINHMLGGVSVTIEDDFSQSDPSLVMGETVLLTDEQAEHYLHDRMNVGDGSNEGRMRRQETYLNAAREKAIELAKTDRSFASRIYQSISSLAVTDMSEKDVSRLINAMTSYEPEKNIEITGTIGEDEFEFATFESDPESLRDAVIELFYNRLDELS